MNNNYGLFDKYLNKVKSATIIKFGSLQHLQTFLQALSEKGNVMLAASSVKKISPLQLQKVIKSDKNLKKCVDLALSYATEAAEGILYDRAINGYEELIFDKAGKCIARKRKYCSKSLLEYLKANSVKYYSKAKTKDTKDIKKTKDFELTSSSESNLANYQIESYEVSG